MDGYCLDVVACKISSCWLEKQLSYGQLKDIWYGMVSYGLVFNGMVHGYCLDVVPCKISSSWLEKQLCYCQFKFIWFGLVWLSLVWFGFELYGAWVLYRCSSMQNVELLA